MTPDAQLERLRQHAGTRPGAWQRPALGGAAAVLLGGAAIVSGPWLALAGAGAAIAAWRLRPRTAHVANAAAALDAGDRQMGRIAIAVSRGTGPVRYGATVTVDMLTEWRFEFVPDQWQPVEGVTAAEVRFLPGIEWPVLVLTDKGIAYPGTDPVRRIPRPG